MTLGEIYTEANGCVRELLRLANVSRLASLEEGSSREDFADLAHLLTSGALATQRELGSFAVRKVLRKT